MKGDAMPRMILFEDCGDSAMHVSCNTVKDFNSHSHDFYEFEYIIDGEGTCEINNKQYPIRKGDVIFVTPLDIHGYRCKRDFKFLTIHFRVDNISRPLLCINTMEACVVACSEPLRDAFELLVKSDDKEEFYDILCEKSLEVIIIRFLQQLKGERSADKPDEIMRAVEYINLNFKNPITLTDVSDLVGYSPEHFSRRFKEHTGKNFVRYLTDIRLSYAKNLLLKQGITVTQACYECGFGCLRNFSRAFKAKYGMSARQYKNQKMS